MDGMRPGDIAEVHIEGVLLSVEVKRLLIHSIRPRTQKRNAGVGGPLAICIERGCGKIDDVLPLNLHLEYHRADGRNDGNGGVCLFVAQANDVAIPDGQILGVGRHNDRRQGRQNSKCKFNFASGSAKTT